MTKQTQIDLGRKVLDGSALELFLQASGRGDLNDVTFNPEQAGRLAYIRAVHNPSKGREQMYQVYTGRKVLCGLILDEQLEVNKELVKSNNIVIYGQIKTKEEKGRIFKKIIEKPTPVSNWVKDGDNSDSYFVRMLFDTEVTDSGGRKAEEAELTIVSNKELVYQVTDYLAQNPGQFQDFVGAMLPRERFPKINEGILSKIRSPDRLVMVDFDKIPLKEREGVLDMQKYGKLVDL